MTADSDAALIDDIEPDRRGLGRAAARHQPSEPRPAAPGRRSLTDIASGWTPAVGSCSSKASPRAAKAARVFAGSEVVSMRAPSVSSATPTMPGDVDAGVAESRRDLRERTRPIIELDREPDRQGVLLQSGDGTRSPAPRGRRRPPRVRSGRCPPRSARPPTRDRCPSSRSSAATTRPTTRAALRFFRERRSSSTTSTFEARPIAPGELRRFIQRLGAARAPRPDVARRTATQGLGYLRMDEAGIVTGCSPTRGCCACR